MTCRGHWSLQALEFSHCRFELALDHRLPLVPILAANNDPVEFLGLVVEQAACPFTNVLVPQAKPLDSLAEADTDLLYQMDLSF